jgi:hypothetical protein
MTKNRDGTIIIYIMTKNRDGTNGTGQTGRDKRDRILFLIL